MNSVKIINTCLKNTISSHKNDQLNDYVSENKTKQ